MTLDAFAVLLDGVGIPTAYRAFKSDKAPPLPFQCWLYLNDNPFAADGVVYYAGRRVRVELYTEYVDAALEEKLETLLTQAELFFEKVQEYIESEGCYQTSYEMEI